MKTNIKSEGVVLRNPTFEGGKGFAPPSALTELRRAVSSCFLWEDSFYESGVSIYERISDLASKVSERDLAGLAVEARNVMGLRHVSLLLLLCLLKKKTAPAFLADYVDKERVVYNVINRPDEMGELISLYWKDGKKPLPAAMKRGLASAFKKFDAYQLAKYNRKVAITLKDILRMVHPRADNEEQNNIWKKIIDGTLESPDTWEVALSSGANKKETFERLLSTNKLGYMALLRNLRNMVESNVDRDLVTDAILQRKGAKNILPFRYYAAAKAAPSYEAFLDKALIASIDDLPYLEGKTVVLVDVSGSMDHRLSAKSDMTRMIAAAVLGSIINGKNRVFTFSTEIVEVPARKGMAGVDAIIKSQYHGSTNLHSAIDYLNKKVKYDRLIVITDEQHSDPYIAKPKGKFNYMINVAGYRNGVSYSDWTKIDGFSENVLRFIYEHEKL